MIRLTYENEHGVVAFGDGSAFGITSLSGFGLPAKEFTNVVYSGQQGAKTTSSRDLQRTMTIGGDFTGNVREITKFYKILYHKGTLKINYKGIKRQIECHLINNDDFIRQGGSNIWVYALQFTADSPYFTDFETTEKGLLERIDKITGSTNVLPAVFTEALTITSVENKGETAVYPIIEVKTYASKTSEGILIVQNETTGAFINLTIDTSKDDIITIDLPVRKIYTAECEVITNNISDDTVLSKFVLIPGENVIKVANSLGDNSGTIVVTLKFKNEYVSALW